MKKIFSILTIFFTCMPFAMNAQVRQGFPEKEDEEEGEGMRAIEYWEKQRAIINKTSLTGPITNFSKKIYDSWKNYQLAKQAEVTMQTAFNGNWTQITQVQSTKGMGRIRCVEFDPSNTNIYYVGTSGGGLWKTINNGASYFPLTDGLPTGGIEDIVIDYTNPNKMLLLTGGGFSINAESVGVLVSYDGGTSWNETDLTEEISNGSSPFRGYKMIMHPTNHNLIFLASNKGVLRSTNGGITWTLVFVPPNNDPCIGNVNDIFDIEFKPDDFDVVYASFYSRIYFSTQTGDAGTWVTGPAYPSMPSDKSYCLLATKIAVSPQSPNTIYFVTATNGAYDVDADGDVVDAGNCFFYKGTINAALTTITYTAPTKVKDGTNSLVRSRGGDIFAEIFVSPTNGNNIYVGGVRAFASSNGGSLWNFKQDEMHVDITEFALHFDGSSTYIYCTNDGGIYKQLPNYTTETPWADITAAIEITQSYNIAGTPQDPSFYMYANQDNCVHTRTASTYQTFVCGDGTTCGIDYTDEQVYYGSIQSLEYLTRYDHGVTTNITPGAGSNCDDTLSYSGAFVPPFQMDENNPDYLYTAKRRLYKSINRGDTWFMLTVTGGVNPNYLLAVAKSNPTVIFLVEDNNAAGILRRSTNGGIGWTNLSGSLPAGVSLSNVIISPVNANRVYITSYGFNEDVKVFVSTNQGNSWTNISAGLPNVSVRCLAYANGSNNGIYAGTDIGVFYRDDNLGRWIPFYNGLPSTYVMDLYINDVDQTISAGTFGRGIWKSDLLSPSVCASSYTFSNTNLSGRKVYSALNAVTATNTTIGGSVTNDIKFSSTQSITLMTGFTANAGSVFKAAIEPCGGNVEQLKITADSSPSPTSPPMKKKNGQILKSRGETRGGNNQKKRD